MNKKDINPVKLINYYKLINHNLIYNNKAINRYKKDNFELSGDKAENLDKLKKSILSLNNCDLKRQAKNIVFSDGNPNSKIMLIGEAPGANEDEVGLPFVGRAGALLDKMLAAIDLDRKKVYISNIINYRPPENRKPTDEEIKRYNAERSRIYFMLLTAYMCRHRRRQAGKTRLHIRHRVCSCDRTWLHMDT